MIERVRRVIAAAFAPMLLHARWLLRELGWRWRRSLQLRVVGTTLLLAAIVLSVVGFLLTSQIADRLLEAKVTAATEQLDRSRVSLERELANPTDNAPMETRLASARYVLLDATSTADASLAVQRAAFDAVLILQATPPSSPASAGPAADVPHALRTMVQQGRVSYQYTTITSDDRTTPALIVGSPSNTGYGPLELYLVFPLSSEESMISLVRGTLGVGSLILVLLFAVITYVVSRQVVQPVRSAARIASRFAEGRLKERMPVHGEDDMARLAVSFNEMAESLSRQIRQLEEFGSLQRQFTSDVSHELRTPLTTVRMAADMIHDGRDDLDPMMRRATELLVAELDRFETLLDELLEISRHDAGVAELSAHRVDMAVPIRLALATVSRIAEESGTELVVDLPPEPVHAEVDSRRVERIMRNLLANAIDHSNGKPVMLRMRADADAVAVTVLDEGVGLRPGEEKLVFNRFWRSDPSRVRRNGGTGLGLAISIEDARLHLGRLEAWGEPGRGACFRLTLPLVRGHKLVGSPLPLRPVGQVAARARETNPAVHRAT